MQKSTGVWVDHRRAVIVSLMDGHQEIKTLESGVERHPSHETGGIGGGATGSQTIVPEGKPERRFEQQMKEFYRDIAAGLEGTERIYIFGPGEARTELHKQLEQDRAQADRVIKVEPADRMADDEIVRKVRAFFKMEKSS